MGYNYEELMGKYRRSHSGLAVGEIDFLIKESKARLIAGIPISVNGFYLATENDHTSYEYGDVTDIWSHGWLIRELIVHIDGKNYCAPVAWHNECGIDDSDTLVFEEVEEKEVTVKRWVGVKKNENRN